MGRPLTIAIDGPAGAGKSTVARGLAARLGLRYLDTGAMYRCAAILAQKLGHIRPDQAAAESAARALAEHPIRFADGDRVFLGREDVTEEIRTPEIADWASALSTNPALRQVLAAQQSEWVAEGGFVLEGRDTTSVVAPGAEVKVYLTASIEERADRRHRELAQRGQNVPYDELVRQIAERDARDLNRAESPLRRVPDAHVIETFGLSPEQVIDRIEEIAVSLGTLPPP